MSVAIVNYGSGNLHSAAKAFERAARDCGYAQPILVTDDPDQVVRAERVVLPGVGAFADCRRGLDAVLALLSGFEAPTLRRFTLARRRFANVGVVVGDDLELAERRFFDAWIRRRSGEGAPRGETPAGSVRMPQPRADVLGLFPEPGATP